MPTATAASWLMLCLLPTLCSPLWPALTPLHRLRRTKGLQLWSQPSWHSAAMLLRYCQFGNVLSATSVYKISINDDSATTRKLPFPLCLIIWVMQAATAIQVPCEELTSNFAYKINTDDKFALMTNLQHNSSQERHCYCRYESSCDKAMSHRFSHAHRFD